MSRDEIINSYIEKHSYKSYLEIGVQIGLNLDLIKCEKKVGVDPWNGNKGPQRLHDGQVFIHSKERSLEAKKLTMVMTSDLFFSAYLKFKPQKFDIIFIDGAHTFENVYKDIINSLNHLSEDGTIVLHDMMPETEQAQLNTVQIGTWNGDGWKGFVKARCELGDKYQFFVLDTDHGCGIIRKSENTSPLETIKDTELNWDNLVANRQKWMNVVDYQDFKKTFLEQ